MRPYGRLVHAVPRRVDRDRLEVVRSGAEWGVFALLALQGMEWTAHSSGIRPREALGPRYYRGPAAASLERTPSLRPAAASLERTSSLNYIVSCLFEAAMP